MAFRTHLWRPLDLSLPSNVALVVITATSAVAALVIWLDAGTTGVWLAPVGGVVYWTLAREIDPDHPWTATLACAASTVWLLRDVSTLNLLAVGATMVAARLTVGTTGRRPLTSDLATNGIGGTGIGFTLAGWIGGFSLAVAMILNQRFRTEESPLPLLIAGLTAIGSTVVLTTFDGFANTVPEVDRAATILLGVVTLLVIAREPAPPVSVVDAGNGARIDKGRLHAGRVLVSVSIFGMALAGGADLTSVAPAVVTLGSTVASNEVARSKNA